MKKREASLSVLLNRSKCNFFKVLDYLQAPILMWYDSGIWVVEDDSVTNELVKMRQNSSFVKSHDSTTERCFRHDYLPSFLCGSLGRNSLNRTERDQCARMRIYLGAGCFGGSSNQPWIQSLGSASRDPLMGLIVSLQTVFTVNWCDSISVILFYSVCLQGREPNLEILYNAN